MSTADLPPLTRWHWILPAALLAVVTVAAWLTNLDLAVSARYYAPRGLVDWPLGEQPFWRFLFRWGEAPAVLLGIGALLALAAGAGGGRPALRRAGAFLLLALVLGPLLITNGALKGFYGRPRPNEVVEFGGKRPFQPVGVPTFRLDENSFPSGHAAAGFALVLPYFVLRGRRPRAAVACLAGGLGWGGLLGFTRIVQGDHFFSDGAWAAAVVYFTGYALARWMERRPLPRAAPAHTSLYRRRRRAWIAAGLASVLVAAAYLARLPIDVSREWSVPLEPGDLKATILFVTEKGRDRINRVGESTPASRRLRIHVTARASGLPFQPVREWREVNRGGAEGLRLRYALLSGWGVSHLSARLVAEAPADVTLALERAPAPGPEGPGWPDASPVSEGGAPPEPAQQGSPMNWTALLSFAAYAGIGLVALLVWWVIYDRVLTRGYSVREAVFGRRPNPAVALDLLGGMLAMGMLVYSIIRGPQLGTFLLDLEAVALSLLGTIALLAVVRMLTAALLRAWFGMRRDAQGEQVNFNNELFRQRNTATGIFSTVLYLILAAGLVEQDLLNLAGARWISLWNILGIWLMGAAVIVLHSLLYLGPRRHILRECFHDNHPAAALSLLGLVGGMLLLTHGLLGSLRPEEHMFDVPQLWLYLALAIVFVLIARLALQLVLRALFGVRLGMELVRDNLAWGLLDGGLIFVLFLILIALIV